MGTSVTPASQSRPLHLSPPHPGSSPGDPFLASPLVTVGALSPVCLPMMTLCAPGLRDWLGGKGVVQEGSGTGSGIFKKMSGHSCEMLEAEQPASTG